MKPLEGVTVLEFSTMITASFAAMMMAEQGATVIKVEPLNVGDPMRYIGAAKGGISSLFANCNRGKRAIRVDLKDEAGQSVIREMASKIDVFIHNFRPGVMDKLNLGSDPSARLTHVLFTQRFQGLEKKDRSAAPPLTTPSFKPCWARGNPGPRRRASILSHTDLRQDHRLHRMPGSDSRALRS